MTSVQSLWTTRRVLEQAATTSVYVGKDKIELLNTRASFLHSKINTTESKNEERGGREKGYLGTRSWCLQALKSEEVNTEHCKGSSDAASVRTLQCGPTGCIFLSALFRQKKLKTLILQTLQLLPIASAWCPSALRTGWGE